MIQQIQQQQQGKRHTMWQVSSEPRYSVLANKDMSSDISDVHC